MPCTINASTSAGLVSTASTDGSLALQTNSGVTALTIDTSQNVGIGTSSIADTSSTGKVLEIYGGANAAHIHFTNSATGQTAGDGFIVGTAVGSTDALLVQRESANMIFRTADTERMRIDSSGNLLVGTTSLINNSRLTVKATGANGVIGTQVATNGVAAIDFLNAAGGEQGYIVVNAGSVQYLSVSDYRLKENVMPMTKALDVVSKLNPVTYNWKVDGSEGQGFIAHELQEIVPDCVSGEKDAVDADGNPKYQGIDTSFLVATLVSAIQEQQALIQTLQTQVAQLQAKVGI